MTLQTVLPANAALIPADALRAGTRLEDYEIDRVIARSAVALVYRALDRSSNQPVAIKEFLPTGLAMRDADGRVAPREVIHEQNLERGRQVFLETAQTLAKCDHPSLMRVLRVMECHGTVYKVMPYCPGPTLLEHRQKVAAAPTEQLLHAWLEDLLGALAQWHEAGQVHGAVSPGNILMQADDRPLLLDSDAVYAAILSDRTRSMIAALEPCFAPQEQCEPAPTRPLGPWTDLYALAATLRFCVSGRLPGTFAQRPRGAAVGAQGPLSLAAIDGCLAEPTKDRPQSVAQLRQQLLVARARSPSALVSAKTGLAPQLSLPLTRSPSMTAPVQPLREASSDVVQLPLPIAASDPVALARVDRSPVGRAAPQPEASSPLQAAAAAEPAQLESVAAPTTDRSRSRLAWAVAALVLVAVVAAAAWLSPGQARRGADEAATAQAAPSPSPSPLPLPPAQPSARAGAAPISTQAPAETSVPQPVGKTEARVEPPTVRRSAPDAPKGKPASTKQPAKPVAAKSAAGSASPRQACAGRERYALLQCMQEQCTKSVWTRHEQCVRLRKDRKL